MISSRELWPGFGLGKDTGIEESQAQQMDILCFRSCTVSPSTHIGGAGQQWGTWQQRGPARSASLRWSPLHALTQLQEEHGSLLWLQQRRRRCLPRSAAPPAARRLQPPFWLARAATVHEALLACCTCPDPALRAGADRHATAGPELQLGRHRSVCSGGMGGLPPLPLLAAAFTAAAAAALGPRPAAAGAQQQLPPVQLAFAPARRPSATAAHRRAAG